VARLRRDSVTWLIYLQLGLYAYFLYGFGPVMSFLRDEQGTSNTLASLHSTAMAVGAMAGGAAFPWLSRQLGRSRLMWAALITIAAGVLGLIVLPPLYPLTLTLIALIALGGLCVVSTVVVSLSHMHGEAGPAAISEANAIAVAAGLVAPLAIGAAVNLGFGWRAGLGVLIGLIGVVALYAWKRGLGIPVVESTPDPASASRPLPAAYWITWTILVFTGCIEIVLSLWAAIVLREELGFGPGTASASVAAIMAGMLLGRVSGARLALYYRPIPLFLGAMLVSLIGFAVFWTASGAILAVTGLFLAGLGNAMHYPLVIALALAAAPGQADRAAGVTSYSMGVSFGAGPFVLGLLADQVGAHTALLLIPVFIVIASLLAWRLAATTRLDARAALITAGAGTPEVSDRQPEVMQQVP
jgi:cyanate permease